MVAHVCDPSTWEPKERGSEDGSQSGLLSRLWPCLQPTNTLFLFVRNLVPLNLRLNLNRQNKMKYDYMHDIHNPATRQGGCRREWQGAWGAWEFAFTLLFFCVGYPRAPTAPRQVSECPCAQLRGSADVPGGYVSVLVCLRVWFFARVRQHAWEAGARVCRCLGGAAFHLCVPKDTSRVRCGHVSV
jgi:hypothetical protein